MIVDGDREHLLGMVLTDDVVVENLEDFLRRRDAIARLRQRGRLRLTDDVHAQFDALVADEDGRPGNELAHLALALAAERAVKRVLRFAAADLAHFRAPTRCDSSQSPRRRAKPSVRTIPLSERPADLAGALHRIIHRAKVSPLAMQFA